VIATITSTIPSATTGTGAARPAAMAAASQVVAPLHEVVLIRQQRSSASSTRARSTATEMRRYGRSTGVSLSVKEGDFSASLLAQGAAPSTSQRRTEISLR